jgi:heat shock protein HslJ
MRNAMRITLFALASLLVLGLAACDTPASSSSFADEIRAHTWAAEAINRKDVVDGTHVTLKIEGNRVSGKAGCNGYGGPAEIEGERITFGALFSTKMACMGNGVMEQEQRYLNMLQSVTRGEIRGDGALVLTGRDGDIEFRAE